MDHIYCDVLNLSAELGSDLTYLNVTLERKRAFILLNVLFPVRLTRKLEERREQKKRGEEEVRRSSGRDGAAMRVSV